jgi:uncharacterized protein YfeS
MKKTTNLYTIGDCIALSSESEGYYGLILWEITETIEYVSYSFLLSGQIFEDLPTMEAFSRAGLLGRRIPLHASNIEINDGTYVQSGKFSLGFDTIDVLDDPLKSMQPGMEILGNIHFSLSTYPSPGSISVAESASEITSHVDHLISAVGTLSDNSSTIDQEVFSLETILGDGADIAPKTIQHKWILSKKHAHPRSLKLMQEAFFWSEIEEFGPFGSDAGHDALLGFQSWRKNHPEDDPIAFIRTLEHQWGFSFPHLRHAAPTVKEFPVLQDKGLFLMSIDQGIIGLTFAQLLLEGTVSESLREAGLYALQRLKDNLAGREENWAKEDFGKLERMVEVLEIPL